MRQVVIGTLVAVIANLAVAAPPYEPYPNSRKSSGSATTSSSSTSSQAPASTYGSGVKTYGIGGSDGDFSYKPATTDTTGAAASTSTVPVGNWDSYSQTQQMQQEIQTLRGQVEQLTHEMEMMRKQARERYLDLDNRINQVRGGGAVVPAGSSGEGPVAPAAEAVGDDKVLYDQASALRRDQKFPESIAVMEDLLKRSPGGVYAPYCEYWLGEMYMVVKPPDLDLAKRHFISLIGNHKDHVKVPDAMYKLGKLFAAQGEKPKAKATLNELIKQHPDKPAANLAKDLLKTL